MRAIITCVVLVVVSYPMLARSELKTIGQGDKTVIVRDQFPDEQKPRFDIFAVRCTKCHAMARPIMALRTGISPVTGGVFDESTLKKYVVKMMRKPNSGIAKDDAKEILTFLTYALSLTADERNAAAATTLVPAPPQPSENRPTEATTPSPDK